MKWEDNFKHTLDQIEPSKAQTEKMWNSIENGTRKRTRNFAGFRFVAVGMCALVLSIGTGIGVNAATDGALFTSIRSFISQSEQQKKVSSESLKKSSYTQVYASALVGCSDDYVIFANERGLIIYGKEQKGILTTLDLQALDCNYFNADTIVTHIFMKENTLYLFNEYKDKKQTSKVYAYDLTMIGKEEALSLIEDGKQISNIQTEWKNYEKNNVKDTFDNIVATKEDWINIKDLNYSQNSIVWTDKDGKEKLSCMLELKNGTYQLYTCLMEDKVEDSRETLALKETKEQTLKPFTYTGNDKIMKTLCDYMSKQDKGYSGEVYIPAPVIYKTIEKGDTVVVFANLWNFTYNKNGNTLDCEAGGENPSRLKLKSDGKGGYTIMEHLSAGGGADYQKDIEAFCKGYSVNASKFIEFGQDSDKIRKELVKMYVKDHSLDIKYYKDYGWDPVSLE